MIPFGIIHLVYLIGCFNCEFFKKIISKILSLHLTHQDKKNLLACRFQNSYIVVPNT